MVLVAVSSHRHRRVLAVAAQVRPNERPKDPLRVCTCTLVARLKVWTTGKMYAGIVKSFNENNNYGFIECEEVKAEYGNDVFVHGKSLEGKSLSIGQIVHFEVAVSAKGQPQALNIVSGEEIGFSEEAQAEPPNKRPRLGEDDLGACAGSASTVAQEAIEWAMQELRGGDLGQAFPPNPPDMSAGPTEG